MTEQKLREKLWSMRTAEIDDLRSQVEQIVLDEAEPQHRRNDAKHALRIIEQVLDEKDLRERINSLIGFRV